MVAGCRQLVEDNARRSERGGGNLQITNSAGSEVHPQDSLASLPSAFDFKFVEEPGGKCLPLGALPK
jgi:hypothetical protein